MSKKVTVEKKQTEPVREKAGFAIPAKNYKLLLIGLGIIVLGFILMAGGGSKDPNEFHADRVFSFTRIHLSTILVVLGFAFEIYAIMRKPKDSDNKDEQA
jgi:hypothetical protein